MSYISLERGKNELSVNHKMFSSTGVYPSKTQPDICAKTFALHVIFLEFILFFLTTHFFIPGDPLRYRKIFSLTVLLNVFTVG